MKFFTKTLILLCFTYQFCFSKIDSIPDYYLINIKCSNQNAELDDNIKSLQYTLIQLCYLGYQQSSTNRPLAYFKSTNLSNRGREMVLPFQNIDNNLTYHALSHHAFPEIELYV